MPLTFNGCYELRLKKVADDGCANQPYLKILIVARV
jgi:hypothetical protein